MLDISPVMLNGYFNMFNPFTATHNTLYHADEINHAIVMDS